MNDQPVRVYIINFIAPNVNLWALTQYLHDSSDIIAYWNYLPLVFCVKSRLTSYELSSKLRPFFPHSFMVVEINPHNINGILPREAWNWFYLQHHTKHQPPVIPWPPQLLPPQK